MSFCFDSLRPEELDEFGDGAPLLDCPLGGAGAGFAAVGLGLAGGMAGAVGTDATGAVGGVGVAGGVTGAGATGGGAGI